jgi:hypothetical protein
MAAEECTALFSWAQREYMMVRAIFDALDRDKDNHLNYVEMVGRTKVRTSCWLHATRSEPRGAEGGTWRFLSGHGWG